MKYKYIILHAVCYGWETCASESREEHRLRVYGNRLLVGLFGLNREVVVGGSRKLHNNVLSNLHSSSSIITSRMNKSRRLRWEMQVAIVGRRGMHIRFLWESQKERDHYDMWESVCSNVL
jgi:hypothetical protein